MNKKIKINYFKIFLILLLIGSITLYVKLYILNKEEPKVIDLPSSITNVTWYEYGTLATMKFSSGSFQYRLDENKTNDKELNVCNRYYYNEDTKIISFDCRNYSMKVVSVSKYKMILVITDDKESNVYTYYNSKDLNNYLTDNNLNSLSDSDIETIMINNDFTVSKTKDSEEYKNFQKSKLSSINELSIDEYLSLKDTKRKSIVLLINPNMSIDSYDIIPIFISWENKYQDCNFYFVNGSNLKVNDYDMLERDKVLKDYLTGLYDSNILIFEDGNYRRFSIDLYIDGYEDKVFNCLNDECSYVEMKIYDSEREYDSIEDILNN